MIRCGCVLAALSWGAACVAAQTLQPDPRLERTVAAIRAEVKGAEALEFTTRLHATDRWSDFAHFQQSAEYLRQAMTSIGLRQVELLSAPADGVTQFGYWTMPLAWDVKQARLEIVEPALPADRRVLADYHRQPASLIMWSGPTPAGGVTADVVEIKPATAEQVQRIDVKGKMVLAEMPADLGRRGALKRALYRADAAGMLSDTTENAALLDGHCWVNAWGDFGWGFTKVSSPLPGFSLTPRQGAHLRELLARGVKVRVHANVETRYYSGTYPYVTAVVPGVGSDEEVLALGHAFELGAQDNATGVAGMLEAAAALTRLIESGRLARPRRAIRILAMPEDYGSSAYIATHRERMRRVIGAVNVDTPAGPYDETPGYAFALNPDVSRSYQDALVMRVAETYYVGIPRRYPRWQPYRASSDSYLSDPTIGVPTLAVSGSSGAVNTHHNSADTLDRVDARSLRDLSALLAAYLFTLAAAGDSDIGWLGEMTLDRSYLATARIAGEAAVRIGAAGGVERARLLHTGLEKLVHSVECDERALRSILRLTSPAQRNGAEAALAPLVDSVRRFGQEQAQRLRRAAGAIAPSAPPPDPRRAGAESMVVVRKRFGPVTLDDLPLESRQGFPGFGGTPAPLPMLTWCDGKRTLAEAIRRFELENGPLDFDFVGYFRFLARHGYVEIRPARASP